ncbi:MAG: 50S ribosomal protein L30 [Fidelibacterota bacterium]
MKGTVRIRLVRSGIGFSRRQKATIRSLGFTRLHQVLEVRETPQIRGMLAKIPHLVEYLPCSGNGESK